MEVSREVREMICPLFIKIKENPSKHAISVVRIYNLAAKKLHEIALKSSSKQDMAAEAHVILSRKFSVMIVNDQSNLSGGLDYEIFCKNLLHLATALQEMSNECWIEIKKEIKKLLNS